MKNKFYLKKKMISLLLCLIIVFNIMPITVYAEDTYPGYGAFSSIPLSAGGTYDIQSDAWNEYGAEKVLTFATKDAGSIEQTKVASDGSWQTYEAGAYTGWEFRRWVVYYDGVFTEGDDPTFDGKYFFSNVGSPSTALNVNQPTLQINKDPEARYNYYIYAIFSPIVTIEIDSQMGNITAYEQMYTRKSNSPKWYIMQNCS